MRRLLLCFLLLGCSAVLAQPAGYRILNKGRGGELFTVTDNLTRGKVNIVEFSSLACPSCKALEPKISALGVKKPELAIGQLMIDRPDSVGIDWQSPLARQYELRSVPYFKVYDAAGKLLVEGEPARKMIAKLLIEADVL